VTPPSNAASASKRPWRVADEIFVDDANGVTVCLPNAERAANAALIVRCVNSHEALVEALEEMIEEVENEDHEPKDWSVAVCLKHARAALKVAKGGEE
jgi:hypothetical protein